MQVQDPNATPSRWRWLVSMFQNTGVLVKTIPWLSIVEKVLAFGLLWWGLNSVNPLWSWPKDPDIFVQFIAMSFLLLVIGLVSIWLFGIPLARNNDIDLESLARDRMRATVGILVMTTLLGMASLITYGVTRPSKHDSDNTNKSSAPSNAGLTIGTVIGAMECPRQSVSPATPTEQKMGQGLQ